MPHTKSLFQLRAFWLVAGLPIIIAVIVWFFIFKSLGYPDIVMTYDGFSRAYDYFKIPLWIAALSLPLAGFYASNHRSAQTAAQIAVSEDKNAFENCIKHRELFSKKIIDIEKRFGCVFKDKDSLYERLYPENNFRHFELYCDDMSFDATTALNVKNESGGNYISVFDEKVKSLNDKTKNNKWKSENDFLIELMGFLDSHFLVDTFKDVRCYMYDGRLIYKDYSKNEVSLYFVSDFNKIIELFRKFCLSPDLYKDCYFKKDCSRKNDAFLKSPFHPAKISKEK